MAEKDDEQLGIIPWVIMILVSALPNIIFREVFNFNPPWLLYAKRQRSSGINGLLAILLSTKCCGINSCFAWVFLSSFLFYY